MVSRKQHAVGSGAAPKTQTAPRNMDYSQAKIHRAIVRVSKADKPISAAKSAISSTSTKVD